MLTQTSYKTRSWKNNTLHYRDESNTSQAKTGSLTRMRLKFWIKLQRWVHIIYLSYVAWVHEHSNSSSLRVTQQKTNDESHT